MSATQAEANQAFVRELLRQREPSLAAAIAVAEPLPCGPRCRVHGQGVQGPFWTARQFNEPVGEWAARTAQELNSE